MGLEQVLKCRSWNEDNGTLEKPYFFSSYPSVVFRFQTILSFPLLTWPHSAKPAKVYD